MRIFGFALSILIFLFVISCSITPSCLSDAEQMLEVNPDSALHFLNKIKYPELKTDKDKAMYGLLYFKALDKCDKPLQPDSLIDFSLDFYNKEVDKLNLAYCYFYKGRILKKAQQFDRASNCYLKSLDLIEGDKQFNLSGHIYSDLGDICSLQADYQDALFKFQKAQDNFLKSHDTIETAYKFIDIGRVHKFLLDTTKAMIYFSKAINYSNDSLVLGLVNQEIGVLYYQYKNWFKSRKYIEESLKFPYKGTNNAIRYFVLSEVHYELEHYDSAIYFANKILNFQKTHYHSRECYRILANSEFYLGNNDQMGIYIRKYQDYSDSVKHIENQSKTTILENLHQSVKHADSNRKNLLTVVLFSIIIVLILSCLIYFLYKRNSTKRLELVEINEKLTSKQEFVSLSLTNKIEEARSLQRELRKVATPDQKVKLDKELYEKTLHFSNWDAFACEINHGFNNIIDSLLKDCPHITERELKWCSLHLLDIPNNDRMILLETTVDGLYKLKQRLAKKMCLISTKELDTFIKEKANIPI